MSRTTSFIAAKMGNKKVMVLDFMLEFSDERQKKETSKNKTITHFV